MYETPEICRYCGGKVALSTTASIYEKGDDKIYLCTNCNAYVCCHKRTGIPLGKLANAALRMKRRETHRVFDSFWKRRGMSRTDAYRWLSANMEIPKEKAHIGNFEMDDCQRLIRLCARENSHRKEAG